MKHMKIKAKIDEELLQNDLDQVINLVSLKIIKINCKRKAV